MKIIISPSKTMTDNAVEYKESRNFLKKTLEILSKNPKVKISDNFYRAFYLYNGLCFRNMNRDNLNGEELNYIKENLIILSALYGGSRAFDLINPYRLDYIMKTEMGNLYKFWGNDIYNNFFKEDELIINLASDEFSKNIKRYHKKGLFLNMEFFEKENNKLKKHSTISKKARGKMLYYLAKNCIYDIEKIKTFNLDNYIFDEELSNGEKFTFIKNIDL